MLYPALLPVIRTPRLPVVDWTDAPADLNGLVRFAERRNLVSARVPSHFKRSILHLNDAAAAQSANASPSQRSSASCRFYSNSDKFSPFTVSEKKHVIRRIFIQQTSQESCILSFG